MKTHPKKTRGHLSKQGAALGLVLVVLLVVGFMGAALLNLGGVASVETSKDLSKDQAFWLAEAGLEEAKTIARKNRDVHGETMAFPASEPRSWSGSLQYGTYQVDVTEDSASPPSFTIVSEGLSQGGLRQAVSLALNQLSGITMGVFGDQELHFDPNTSIYSYHSSDGPPPTPDTGEAQIGSNNKIYIQPNFELDGEINLGADPLEENNATIEGSGGGGFVSTAQTVGHVDPDPLGLFGDPANPLNLSGDFQAAQSGNNDNNDPAVTNLISNNVLDLGNSETATLPTGDYYLSDAYIGNHSTLYVDATAGPVTIYLSGEMLADSFPTIDLIGGDPADFRIIANGSEPDVIEIKPDGDFSGFIYAPNMTVHMYPTGKFEGAIWAHKVHLKPNGEIYIDMDVLDYSVFNAYSIAWGTWQQVPR